ncbi:MAG TPA: DUF2950 domain-containing protein [Thermoanaerobaculia bacterium]|nr:DUF2950 domain-containing protein [Thermoanaerobaculia bacterium]
MRQNRIRLVAGILGAAILSSAAFGAETAAKQRTFKTSKEAAEALVAAAAQYDVPSLVAILGPAGKDLVQSDDAVMDKNLAAEFAKQAKEKLAVVPDKANPKRATVIVGGEDWPLPVPLVENAGAWRFDTAAGKREILVRRIGRNELDAIQVCNGYVEAQQEYASEPRGGSGVTQYAQRVVGSADQQDGLAWRDKDGTWRGPIGQKIAGAIAEGYSNKYEPYHGYYFKILKGQGPHAPLGQLDYVVRGVMIGGFGLVAAPADYRVTGVKTFMVSNDGVVYEKDLGPNTLAAFRMMERFDPDSTWTPVEDQ